MEDIAERIRDGIKREIKQKLVELEKENVLKKRPRKFRWSPEQEALLESSTNGEEFELAPVKVAKTLAENSPFLISDANFYELKEV